MKVCRTPRGLWYPRPARERRTTSAGRRSGLLESMGISVEFSHHEGAPGQNEIDLRYADALTTADNIMTFRAVDQGGRARAGHLRQASCPSRSRSTRGSGMHTHLSLFAGDGNAFHEAGGSVPAQSKVGPSVHCRPAAPCVGDHRGHQPVGQLLQAVDGWCEAPSYVCWGHNRPVRAGARPDVQAEQGAVEQIRN